MGGCLTNLEFTDLASLVSGRNLFLTWQAPSQIQAPALIRNPKADHKLAEVIFDRDQMICSLTSIDIYRIIKFYIR
jgi:hypothetical protein